MRLAYHLPPTRATKYEWADVLGPLEAPLGYPQSWTFCSYGPVIAWAAYFLWKDPTLPLQQFQYAFFSLDQGWVSTQDQQESEGEEEVEDLLGAWICSCP